MIQLSNRKAEDVLCCLRAASQKWTKESNPLAAADADALYLNIREQLKTAEAIARSRSRATRNAKKIIA